MIQVFLVRPAYLVDFFPFRVCIRVFQLVKLQHIITWVLHIL